MQEVPVPEYIADFVAKQKKASDAEQAAWLVRKAELEREGYSPALHEISDPSLNGPSGATGYAWMRARGD